MAGPLIISELLERGVPTIGLVVGSEESIIACNNTLNTLKTLESISAMRKKPVVMYYEHNTQNSRRSDVDLSARNAVAVLSMLASRENEELDMRDIHNFVNYNTVSSVQPRLSTMQIFSSNEKVNEVDAPLSIASIYGTPDDQVITVTPDYHCAGYSKAIADSEDLDVLHFLISTEETYSIGKGIKETLDRLNQIRDSRVESELLVNENDKANPNGLVL